MIDMNKHIIAKSDQLNAADLGPRGKGRIIRITRVREADSSEQPIIIDYEGGEGRPWKPSKGMRRLLAFAWQDVENAEEYAGRYVEVYNDPDVLWAGEKSGGIRISRMSHISEPVTYPLPISRTKRIPFTVQPLVVKQRQTPAGWVDEYIEGLKVCADLESLLAYQNDEARAKWVAILKDKHATEHKRVVDANAIRYQELAGEGPADEQRGEANSDAPEDDDDQFPGGAE